MLSSQKVALILGRKCLKFLDHMRLHIAIQTPTLVITLYSQMFNCHILLTLQLILNLLDFFTAKSLHHINSAALHH